MRELKFRVWCPTIKRFSTAPWIGCDGLQLRWCHTGNEVSFTDIRFDEYVIQQFTGLKDKAGRDIYEGDIIKEWPDSEDKSKIIMSSEGIWWAANLDSESGMGQELYMYPKCLVVGNIFENTELLK